MQLILLVYIKRITSKKSVEIVRFEGVSIMKVVLCTDRCSLDKKPCEHAIGIYSKKNKGY